MSVHSSRSFVLQQHHLANAFFLLMFVGLFIYQTLIAKGWIPVFAGAYWGMVNLLMLFPLLFGFLFIGDMRRKLITRPDYLALLYLSYFTVVFMWNMALGKDIAVVYSHVASMVQFVVIFLIFRMLKLEVRSFSVLNALAWLLITLGIMYFSANGVFNYRRDPSSVNLDYIVSYGLLGLIYLSLSVVTLMYVKNMPLRLCIYFLSLIALFLNGSRSDLVALLLVAVVIESVNSSASVKIVFAVVFSLVMSLAVSLGMAFAPQSRIFLMFSSSGDGSMSERDIFLAQGLEAINRSPFWGDYASYEPGSYAHNILSAWVDLGVVGFVLLLVVIFLCLAEVLHKVFWLKIKSSYLVLALCFFVVSAVLMLFVKNFTYLLLPAALGIYSNYLVRRGDRK